jgi:kynurenine formamidase
VIPEGALVLLFSGWDAKWVNPDEYMGTDERSRPRYPGFGLAAARLLIDERGVAGLGTDSPGVEPGVDAGFSVNRLVLARPRIVLENLCNLHELPPVGATIVIGVLKLKGGSGSPAAVLAFVA